MFYSQGSKTFAYDESGDHTNSHEISARSNSDSFVHAPSNQIRNVGDPMPAAKSAPDAAIVTRDARRLSTLLEVSQALSGTLNLKSSMQRVLQIRAFEVEDQRHLVIEPVQHVDGQLNSFLKFLGAERLC